jgi:CBS domain-containing protein
MMAEPVGRTKRVTIVLRSGNVHRSAYMHVLQELRRLGVSGATAFQGAASFVGQNPIHSNRLAVDYIPDLPVFIVWIDRPEVVDRVLPEILPLVKDGVVTVDETDVVHSASTEVGDLPSRELVRDVMSRHVVSARPETPIAEIVKDLLERRFRAVPVVDETGAVVGVITNSDLVGRGGLAVRLELLHAIEEGERRRIIDELAGSAHRAADVMTASPVTVAETATIRDAADLMLSRHLKRLPVVDDQGRLSGIVSRVDLLRTVTFADTAENGATDVHAPASAPVMRVMNKDVPVVGPDDPVAHLINVVVSTRLNRAVVVDGDRRPIGLVSDAELIERVTPEARPGLVTTLMRRLPLMHGSVETQETLQHAKGRTAREFMRSDFLQVATTATIRVTLEEMLSGQRKIAVVVDEDGRLAGMADRRDLLSALT